MCQFYECTECGNRYDHTRDIKWHHYHFCGHKCLEDFKEDHPEIRDDHNGHDLQLSLNFGETQH